MILLTAAVLNISVLVAREPVIPSRCLDYGWIELIRGDARIPVVLKKARDEFSSLGWECDMESGIRALCERKTASKYGVQVLITDDMCQMDTPMNIAFLYKLYDAKKYEGDQIFLEGGSPLRGTKFYTLSGGNLENAE